MELMKRVQFFVFALLSFSVSAQDFPNRPIRILQGFAPGGNADAVARVLANEMQKGLGQPIVVEARIGAGGNLAADAVAKAAPDGYTLLLAVGGHAVSGAIYKSLPYRTVEDFAWISTATVFPFMLTVSGNSNFRSLQDLLVAAKTKPETVKYGTAAVGATQHLTGELLASMAAVKFLHVPYKGDAGALVAILGGDVDFIITPATAPLSNIKAGKLKAVAVTGAARWAGMPDVPTVREAGVAGFDVGSWAGLATTAGTPPPVVMRLHAEMQRALQAAEVRARLEGFGGEVRGSTPDEMRARVAAETQRWAQVIDAAGIERQ